MCRVPGSIQNIWYEDNIDWFPHLNWSKISKIFGFFKFPKNLYPKKCVYHWLDYQITCSHLSKLFSKAKKIVWTTGIYGGNLQTFLFEKVKKLSMKGHFSYFVYMCRLIVKLTICKTRMYSGLIHCCVRTW